VTPHLTPLVGRTERVEGMPPELQRVLFALKPNEATMLETPEGFIVAIPAEIAPADPKSDPMGFEQTRAVVTRSISGDIGAVFTEALRLRANPKINQKNFDQIVQP
jgi:peptidyl-prolyl cis-trans isomerase D